jgi:dipeptidyl aminopeptidase/acylaminoacyl peptidase
VEYLPDGGQYGRGSGGSGYAVLSVNFRSSTGFGKAFVNAGEPLLIAQGANDPRVKQAEADQMVKALKEKGIPVAYLLYPDEDHRFAQPENNIAFRAVAKNFLARHLGGRAEPIHPEELTKSTIEVKEGAAELSSPQ